MSLTSPVPPSTPGSAWTVVIPVKPAVTAKTRLKDVGSDRVALARAIALDTISAAATATRVAQVIVVTDDAELTAAASAITRVAVLPEKDLQGLDAAIAVGMESAGPVARAALLGDLPALRPDDLDAALAQADVLERGLVPDAEGTGSTLVTARAGAVWLSAFGENSAERHRLLGCVDLDIDEDSSLRRDVDTADQLTTAVALGVGPRTAALLDGSVAGLP